MTDTDIGVDYFAAEIGRLIKSELSFDVFAKRLKLLLKMAWQGTAVDVVDADALFCDNDKNGNNLVDVCRVAERLLDGAVFPLDMLVQAIEAYKVQSVAELTQHQMSLIALINWSAQLAATPVQVAQSTIDGAGFGLFATADIGANVALVPYGGESIDSAAEARYGGAYVVEVDRSTLIDGACGFRLCEMARWANGHPCAQRWCGTVDGHGRSNNCALVRNPHDRNRIYLTTIVPIEAGKELFAVYGDCYRWELLGYTARSQALQQSSVQRALAHTLSQSAIRLQK